MKFQPDNVYHVFNQGNNKQTIFNNHDDYLLFLHLIRKLIKPHCEIIAYCLMPNHFHLMLATDKRCNEIIQQGGNSLDVLTNGIRKLLSGYARAFNQSNNRTGSLLRQKTKTKLLSCEVALKPNEFTGDYYSNCFYYIHLNPFVAGLVNKVEDWPYSSCMDYALKRAGTLINIDYAKKYCGYNKEHFLNEMYGRKDIPFEF